MDYHEDTRSFTERMDDARDRAAWRRHDGAPARVKVDWRMPASKRTTTADGLAAILEVSGARARLLLASGRVLGAYRARKGKNRPWVVPLRRQSDGRYLPTIRPGSRGPLLDESGHRGDSEVPF